MASENSFKNGLRDGLPICFAYLSISFAFGIFALSSGLSAWEALLLSMANVTSAGQFSAVPIITVGGSFLELILTQFVINLRYALMSISLTQRFDDKIRLRDRLLIAFMNTDEIFAVASSKEKKVGKLYMFGLALTPYLGWSLGTLAGAIAGDILPKMLTDALGLAIYGMFIAIVLPAAKKEKKTALCVLCAIVLSNLFVYCPGLNRISDGIRIILCSVTASLLFAALDCKKGQEASR